MESLNSHNIFETKTLKDDYYEQEEGSHILRCYTIKEDSLISNIDGSDDYWNFLDNPTCENIIENPIHDMSSKGSVYSKICGSPIYDTSIEGSVDTWENLSMEEEHSKFSHDHPKSYHGESHKGISNEDLRSSIVKSQMSCSQWNISLNHLIHM